MMEQIKPDLDGIKNIVFDFGRVLLNIDPKLTQIGLMELGYRPDNESAGAKDDEVVVKLERGAISENEFIDTVISVVREGATREDIIRIWNAMLLDFPESHVATLRKLRKDYRIFLLSNSNSIHFNSYTATFRERYGIELDSLFDKMWFSFHIGIIKPDPAIFRYILEDENLIPSETLFIDDTLVHVKAAESTGIRGFHLSDGHDISDLF
ncbi:MAG TPA: HAD family phosphatase [Lentimicrobium sp.]|nr:HAD family phosphatase [Lentimicrobium sp.]